MKVDAPHPISLETVIFTKSVVISIPEHVPGQGPKGSLIGPVNNINVSKYAGDERVFAATMTTVFNPERDKAAPYFADIECMGIFRVDDTLEGAEAIRGVTITANSVLFGAIRESVAWLTSRQMHGPLVFGLSVLKAQPGPAPQKKAAD